MRPRATIVSVAPPPGLRSAGPPRYLASGPTLGQRGPEVWRVLRDYQLAPGATLYVGLPIRTWPCAVLGGWSDVPDFDVTMRFAGFTHMVQLPWGTSGSALIMREPGGLPGQPDTFCLPGTALPPPPPGSELPNGFAAISGMIIRIQQAARAGDLRLTRLKGPDADLGFNNPACLVARRPGQPAANFDLSWTAVAGQHTPSPSVRISIVGPHGEPVTALIPQGPEFTRLACVPARKLALPAQAPGARFMIGLVMRRPKDEWPRTLRVSIDGHAADFPLTAVCSRPGCFTGNPGIRYQPGTPYSHLLRI